MARFAITRFRFLGLHIVSWLVGFVVSVAVILIVIPGDFALTGTARWDSPRNTNPGWADEVADEVLQATVDRYDLSDLERHDVVVYEHGWPMTYLVRSRYFPMASSGRRELASAPWITFDTEWTRSRHVGPEVVSWSDCGNWPIESDSFQFRIASLLANLVIGIGIVAGAVMLIEWRARNRRGFFRFRLVDLLTGITALALLLGWWQYHRQAERIDQQTLVELDLQRNVSRRITHNYVGPQWLLKLAGNTELLPDFLFQITDVALDQRPIREDDLKKVSRMRFLTSVACRHPISVESLRILGENDRLRQLSLHFPSQEELAGYDMPLGKDSDVATSANLHLLSQLPLLMLELNGEGVRLKDVEPFAQSKRLRAVFLSGTGIPDAEIEEFQKKHVHLVVRGWSRDEDW